MVKCEVLTATNMKVAVFLDAAWWSLVDILLGTSSSIVGV
jgi:hypothetical protein